MGKRLLLNLILVAVVALLGLVAWLEPGKAPPAEPQAITDLAPAAVQRIRIEPAGAAPIELRREGAQWHITVPFDAPASPYRVEAILKVAQAKRLASFPAEPSELARYGLAAPRVVLHLDGEAVAFGDQSPMDPHRYVRVGDTVHLIQDTSYYHLAGDATTLVSLNPLPAAATVTGLELPGLALRREAGRWQVEPEAALTPDQANALVDAWQRAQAIGVQRHAGEATGRPVAVSLEGQAEPIRFLLAEQEGDPLLLRPELGLAWHLPEASRGELLPTGSDP